MLTLAYLPRPLVVGVAVALGLSFGSFLNVVIHRLPRGESLVRPGSHCPSCGAPVRPWDNIPIVSYLILRGKARCCGVRISPRYLLVELLGGLLAWAVVETLVLELSPDTPWWQALATFALYLALGLGLIAAAFIDLEHMYLPDVITLGGTLLGIATVPVRSGLGFSDATLGAAAGFLMVWLPFDILYAKIRGRPGMGLGDAKLVMLAGSWFGWQGALFALLAGAVQATLVSLAVLLTRGRIEEPEAVRREREELRKAIDEAEGEERRRLAEELARDPIGLPPEPGIGTSRLAFGPFLALAILEYMLFGQWLVDAYLSRV